MGLKLNGKYWMIRKTHPKVLFSEYDSRETRVNSIKDFTRTLTINIDSDTPVADIYKHITKSDMRSVVKEQAIYSESKYVDEIPELLKEAVYEDKEFNEFALAEDC
jgi:hypothetical protein